MVTALEGLVVVFVVSLEYMRRRARVTSLAPPRQSADRTTDAGAPVPPLTAVGERGAP